MSRYATLLERLVAWLAYTEFDAEGFCNDCAVSLKINHPTVHKKGCAWMRLAKEAGFR